jgi:hypothetical protein
MSDRKTLPDQRKAVRVQRFVRSISIEIAAFCAGIAVACAGFTGLVVFVGMPAKQEWLKQWQQERQLWKYTSPDSNLISDDLIDLWMLLSRLHGSGSFETCQPTTYPIPSSLGDAPAFGQLPHVNTAPAHVSFGALERMSSVSLRLACSGNPVRRQYIHQFRSEPKSEAICLEVASPLFSSLANVKAHRPPGARSRKEDGL